MARLPLLHKSAAYAGEEGAAADYLDELAHRLRHEPTAEECEAAAEILEHLRRRGALDGGVAYAAAGLKPAHPPRHLNREFAIYEAVNDLVWKGVPLPDARRRVGEMFPKRNGERLSASRVKEIHTKWTRWKEEHDRVTRDQLADD